MPHAKILLIDDEKELLELIGEQLAIAGYEVITAENGEDGIIKARMLNPDLVICDMHMPKKDGFAVLRELKNNNFTAPFIMLTVEDKFDKIKKAYDEEADFYITKPVELEKLLKNIKILLNISKNKER